MQNVIHVVSLRLPFQDFTCVRQRRKSCALFIRTMKIMKVHLLIIQNGEFHYLLNNKLISLFHPRIVLFLVLDISCIMSAEEKIMKKDRIEEDND